MAKSTIVDEAGHPQAVVATNAIVQAVSNKVARLLIALCVAVLADLPEDSAIGAPLDASAFEGKMEIKLVVPADKVAGATKILKLGKQTAVEGEVVFFDTEDGALFAKNLILRARQKPGGFADSTVKLRTTENVVELSEVEKAIKPEADWTGETDPSFSRSVDNALLPDDFVRQVAEGKATADKLFNNQQRGLVESRMKNFNWSSLKCYGPIQAEVWEQKFKLKGFPNAVTVERWHMKKNERTLDILEVSAKARPQTAVEAKELAKQFFKAAAQSGLGNPGGLSKTEIVLNFFKPDP